MTTTPATGTAEELGAPEAPRAPARRPAAGRALRAAGAGYLLAWLVGLPVAPAAPKNGAATGDIHAYFAANGTASVIQTLLVHGVAGLALVALALGFGRALAAQGRVALAVTGAGLAAAAVSLVQVAFAVGAAHDVAGTAPATTAAWFHAVNDADVAKLVLLAVFAGAVTRAGRPVLSAWLRITGSVLAPLLVVGGLEFVVDNAVLGAALALSLVVLLVWAAGTAWQLGRQVGQFGR